MKQLTLRQQEVLQYVYDFLQEKWRQPSFREIMKHFRWTGTNAVNYNFTALERKGYIKRVCGRHAIGWTLKGKELVKR